MRCDIISPCTTVLGTLIALITNGEFMKMLSLKNVRSLVIASMITFPLVLSAAGQIKTPTRQGGNSGGGGDIYTLPASEKMIREIIGNTSQVSRYIFNALDDGRDSIHDGMSLRRQLYTSISGMNVFDRISKTVFYISESGSCPKPPGELKNETDLDASAIHGHGAEPDKVCYNLKRLLDQKRNPIITEASAFHDITGLTLHEITHLQGMGETFATNVELDGRGGLSHDLQRNLKYKIDGMKDEVKHINDSLKNILFYLNTKDFEIPSSMICSGIGLLMGQLNSLQRGLEELKSTNVLPFRIRYKSLVTASLFRTESVNLFCEPRQVNILNPEVRKQYGDKMSRRFSFDENAFKGRPIISYTEFLHSNGYAMNFSGVVRKVDFDDRITLAAELQDIANDFKSILQSF